MTTSQQLTDQFEDIVFIIPARKGSKGVPLKNRGLIDQTVKSLPPNLWRNIIVTSDDEWIEEYCAQRQLTYHARSAELSGDKVDIKSVMRQVIGDCNLDKYQKVIMLYVVWPYRTFDLIQAALKEYLLSSSRSLLCATPVKSHPYMTFRWVERNRGEPVVKHQLFRRQDYPECFVINHIVTIFDVGELASLNEQLYNSHTFFFPVREELNIDEPKDWDDFISRQTDTSR